MKVELWILTDKYGRIYYTGYSEELVKSYKEDNLFHDKIVLKLEGEVNV